jgi:hypothetical protein
LCGEEIQYVLGTSEGIYREECFLTHVLTAELGSFESKQVDVVPFDLLSESCRTGSLIEK